MSEYFEHNPDDHEDPSAGPTWLIGFIGVVLLVVVVIGVTGVFFGTDDHEGAAVQALPAVDLEALRLEQQARLAGPARWEVSVVDGQAGERRLVIPIEQAMRKVVEESGGS